MTSVCTWLWPLLMNSIKTLHAFCIKVRWSPKITYGYIMQVLGSEFSGVNLKFLDIRGYERLLNRINLMLAHAPEESVTDSPFENSSHHFLTHGISLEVSIRLMVTTVAPAESNTQNRVQHRFNKALYSCLLQL